VLFKTTALASEFFRIHPDLRRVLFELDAKVSEWGFPDLTLTHLHRTLDQQEDFKWRRFAKQGLAEAAARTKARRLFSWHLADCGADFRRHVYNPEQVREISNWLRARCPSPVWEFIDEEEGGTAPHFHLANQDYSWRRRYERETGKSTGAA
jgi:hypothetical protein